MNIIFIVSHLFFAIIILFLLGLFLGFFTGAPYVRARRSVRKKIWDFSSMRAGQKVLDLGSGDGVVLRELAKHGAYGIGWEIHPVLVVLSRLTNAAFGYGGKITIERKNLWKNRLPTDTDIIIVYGIGPMMKKLTAKLQKELNAGAKIVSIGFQIPDLKIRKQEEGLFLYIL